MGTAHADDLAARLVDCVATHLEVPVPSADDGLLAQVEELRELTKARSEPRVAAALDALFQLEEHLSETSRRQMTKRLTRLRGIQKALSHLQGMSQPQQVYDAVVERLCHDCGFDRAILFGVDGEDLVAQSVYFRDADEWAAEVLAFARSDEGRPKLGSQILETEMLRKRTPGIVTDPQTDPRATKPLVALTRTTSYVAAPVMPDGRVIGFLHADHHGRGEEVGEVDKDVLWAFAEGCGFAIQRTLQYSHMAAEQARLLDLITNASAIAGQLTEAQLALEHSTTQAAAATSRAFEHLAGPAGLLTRREREVMELLVQGESNASISARLFIAEGTTKAHVKHILRKLGAANRAEAVARYLRPG